MTSKIALVLGGGGSRGLAHIGVLEILVREQIPIDSIVATSMGGIVGSLFGLGLLPNQIAHALTFPPRTGLENVRILSSRIREERWHSRLEDLVQDHTFADLKLPLTLMAVDMLTGEEVMLTEGPLLPALLATSAVPGVFPPVVMGDKQLADGGVIDSLATHVAVKQGADKIIAVDVHPALESESPWIDPLSAVTGLEWPSLLPEDNETFKNINIMGFKLSDILTNDPETFKRPNLVASLWRAVRVMTWNLHQTRLTMHPPDILMRPNVDQYGSLDFKDMAGPIAAGMAEAERHVEALRRLIA